MASLTLETLLELPDACRACVRWELPQEAVTGLRPEDQRFEKEAWLSRLLLSWPAAGRVALVDEVPAGYVLVAPTDMVPRSASFPTSPVSHDAALLVTGHVQGWASGTGIGRMLLQGIAKDLTRRGFRALEVFGVRADGETAADPPDEVDRRCMLPAGFAEAVGFTVVADDPVVPRLRLELGAALDWREDVEAALDRLLSTMSLTSR